jgi:hypothetical protein
MPQSDMRCTGHVAVVEGAPFACGAHPVLRNCSSPFNNGTSLARTASQHSTAPVERMSFFEVARVAVGFCLLWFLANYFYNLAVTMTTVSSVTIISSTSGMSCPRATMGMTGPGRLLTVPRPFVWCSTLLH